MRPSAFIVTVLLAGAAGPLVGQSDPTLARSAPDSELVHRITTAVYEYLAPVLASEALGRSWGPWEVSLPDTVAPWRDIREHLARALPLRPADERDTTRHRLRLSATETNGDSAVAWLKHAGASRCPDRSWRWHEERYEIRVQRRGGRWQTAVWEQRVQGSSVCPPDPPGAR